jgi:CelD/BcsL family acetyltransferase involved in cellulose biosynthesis
VPPAIRTARTAAEVDDLRGLWQRVRWSRQDADIDYFLAVTGSVGGDARPHVLAYEDGGSPQMLVARVESTRLAASFGYKEVYRPRVRCLTLVHGGVSAPDDVSTSQRLLAEVDRALSGGEADLAVMPSLRRDSAFFRAARDHARGLRADRFPQAGTHRRLVLPDSYDAFLASRAKKTRDGVKRYRNRIEREFGADVTTAVLRRSGEIDQIFRELGAIAQKTYQHGLGVAFADTPYQRSLVATGLSHGWYRAYVMYLRGVPIAFWPGYSYNGTFFIGTPGYDPAFADYRVGMYLQMKMIDDLCVDPEVTALDYGFGDAEYKRRFSNESWDEETVILFGTSLRALRVSALRTGVLASDRAARRMLAATGMLDRVKRRWRGRLAQGD